MGIAARVSADLVAAGSTVASKAGDVASSVAGAVATALTREPPPPPREQWTYDLLDSFGCSDPGVCIYGCCCPCLATADLQAYRTSGKEDARPSQASVFLHLFICYMCGDGLMAREREKIREKTNLVQADGCDSVAWNDCFITMCCYGCAAVQMKRELAVWFGHAGEGAPVHPGSPAAKGNAQMARS